MTLKCLIKNADRLSFSPPGISADNGLFVAR